MAQQSINEDFTLLRHLMDFIPANNAQRVKRDELLFEFLQGMADEHYMQGFNDCINLEIT